MFYFSQYEFFSEICQSTGEMCAAKFVDEEWYRAKIEKMSGDNASVLYVDYGNR